MRVLVTGGTGFIGRHLAGALLGRGATVCVAGRRRREQLPADLFGASVDYRSADLCSAEAAGELVASCRPDVVFHLASAVDVARDLAQIETQVRGTQMPAVHVARACLEHGVGRLVHVGTCEEYGNGRAPFREEQAAAPVSPYSAAKVAATAYVRMLSASFGLRAVIVRPFLTYGPGQDANLFVPALIRSALAGRDFPMTAGAQTREFNYVDDIVDGLLRAADSAAAEGLVVNLGCGEPHRIAAVAQLVLDLMGNPIRAELGKLPYRPGETWEFYCDNRRAREVLGWTPRVPLEEGLRRTIAWFRARNAAAPA
jgi:nucleoside-diphosphate-sugar epimerase